MHEGETGVLFRAGEVAQLARAISFLVERPQLAAEMGAAGRSLVARHYTPENHYAALTGLYEQLAPKIKERQWQRDQFGREAGAADCVYRRPRRDLKIQWN